MTNYLRSSRPAPCETSPRKNCKVLTQRGQVHVFGQYAKAIAIRVGRKMDQTPDFQPLAALREFALTGLPSFSYAANLNIPPTSIHPAQQS